jgi:serine protease Do
MKTKWIISIITTIIILGAGVFAFFYIRDMIPKKLTAASNIVVMDDKKRKINKKTCPGN